MSITELVMMTILRNCVGYVNKGGDCVSSGGRVIKYQKSQDD